MASRPPNLVGNSFALLAPLPNKKRKPGNKNDFSAFPMLPVTKTQDPKFIVISAKNTEKPISSYSCSAVHKSLLLISKDIISISQLRDGNLLLLVKSKQIAEKFISTKQLASICEITVKYHENLNLVKGTVFAPFLNNVPESEIVNELASQGVVSVYKFLKTVDNDKSPSGVILLTFDLYTLPSTINIAWTKVHVRQHIPTPMRCKNCQLLGHTSKNCKRNTVCENCSLPPHAPTNCSRTFCANCSEQHPSSSKDCQKFIQTKEILSIKTKNKCSMREAQKLYQQSLPTTISSNISFAKALTSNSDAVTNNKKSNSNSPTNNSKNININNSPNNNKNRNNIDKNLSTNNNTYINDNNHKTTGITVAKQNKANDNDGQPSCSSANLIDNNNLPFKKFDSFTTTELSLSTQNSNNNSPFRSCSPSLDMDYSSNSTLDNSNPPSSYPAFLPLSSLEKVIALSQNSSFEDDDEMLTDHVH